MFEKFSGLPKKAKTRTGIFFLLCLIMTVLSFNSVMSYKRQLTEQILKNNQQLDLDGADFSSIINAGADAVNSLVNFIVFLALMLFCLAAGAVISAVLRAAVLRKAYDVQKDEFDICAVGYCLIEVLELIVSLIVTQGHIIAAIALFELPCFGLIWLMYLLLLRKRSKPSGHGHFVQGTEQDLTEL